MRVHSNVSIPWFAFSPFFFRANKAKPDKGERVAGRCVGNRVVTVALNQDNGAPWDAAPRRTIASCYVLTQCSRAGAR